MRSFYFEQLLENGLNGIDRHGITGAVLQIAGVILILSLLWRVYEAYSNGGDVRSLDLAGVKYLAPGLVFLNYQSAFRAETQNVGNNGLRTIADSRAPATLGPEVGNGMASADATTGIQTLSASRDSPAATAGGATPGQSGSSAALARCQNRSGVFLEWQRLERGRTRCCTCCRSE